MAAMTSPLRVCRGILKEIRALKGREYKQTLAYNYVLDQFRKNQVSSERYCRAQEEALHTSQSYLCLLASTRLHLALHNLYHGKGERAPEQVAGMVGLRLPTQPGGRDGRSDPERDTPARRNRSRTTAPGPLARETIAK